MTNTLATTPWAKNFTRYKGVKEIKGPKTAPEILALLDWADGKFKDGKTVQGIKDDETPYCSSALCGAFEEVGFPSPRSAWARDWLKWGERLDAPAMWSVVVFERGAGGHVGLVAGRNSAGNLIVFGANQDDQFKYSAFEVKRVLGYRWPAGVKRPEKMGFQTLPITSATASNSEA